MELTRTTIEYRDEAEWLALRAADITSTEAAGLFDAGVYDNARTFYELFNVKAGVIEPVAFAGNDRTKWGNRLESAIAAGVAEDLGLIVEPFKVYMRIEELRLGSSFDFKIVGIRDGYRGDETARDMFRQHGVGIMEVKNVDGLQFKRAWQDEGDVIEAPAHIEMQVQHQLEVADLGWSLIAPLVGGHTPRPIIRVRDLEVGHAIRERARRLWTLVEIGQAPQPDFVKDADVISRVYLENDGSTLDLSDDTDLAELCALYKQAAAEEKAAGERKKEHRAAILYRVKAAKSVKLAGFSISAGTNKESYRLVRRDTSERITITVSQIPASEYEATVPAYRNVRITEKAA
jgi:predicted phage-related endonuclease